MMNQDASKTLILWIIATVALFSSWKSFASDQPADALGNGGKGAQVSTYNLNEYLANLPIFTLPFYLFNGHMLIDGAINGKRGKFLFDTGTEFPFLLNNHYLSLSKDQVIGQGQTGSGQKMVLYRQETPVITIEIAGQIRFENVPAVLHTAWSFLEQAYTPNFFGSVGHGFNRNYRFVIDYDDQTITFHAINQDDGVLSSVINPVRVIATLKFTPTGVDGKIPEVELLIGNETITAFFDTGSHGTLELTEGMKKSLEARGNLTLTKSKYAYGTYETNVRGTMTGLSYGPKALHEARNLDFKIGTQNRLGLGYYFLKDYITVWDYKHRTLTLLKR